MPLPNFSIWAQKYARIESVHIIAYFVAYFNVFFPWFRVFSP